MEKVKEVIAKVTHKDTDTTHTGTHDSKHTGTHDPTHTGTHDPTHAGTTGTHTGTGHSSGMTGGSTTAGPHNSNALNKGDPRVDSDADGSRNLGAAQHGPGGAHSHNHGTTGSGLTGTTGTHGTTGSGLTGSSGYGSSTSGPYDSNLANKADPRVDSDRDGSRNFGAAQHGPGAHQHGTTGATGSGYGSTGTTGSGLTGSTGNHGSTNVGPHSTNTANYLDPRVDSDRDGSRNFGAAQHGSGAHNTGSSDYSHGTHSGSGLTGTTGSTNSGPYDSNIANKADPRVDSDRDGSHHAGAGQHGHGAHQQHGTAGGLSSGPGPAPNTAGPHKSDMLNKMDPRIDSDQNGSKTVGKAPPTY